MLFPSIRIEGAILSADLLDKIAREESPGQRPVDFGLPPGAKVKDEIAAAWADTKDMWRIYQRRLDRVRWADYLAAYEPRFQQHVLQNLENQ